MSFVKLLVGIVIVVALAIGVIIGVHAYSGPEIAILQSVKTATEPAYQTLAGLVGKPSLPTVDSAQLETLKQDAAKQTETLSERAQEVSKQAQEVLGKAVTVNEEESNVADRAIEYGQYLYCQQVVKDYEARNQPTTTPTATP